MKRLTSADCIDLNAPAPTYVDRIQWRSQVVAFGFSWRKRALVREFTCRDDVRFVSRGPAVPAGADLLLWGSTDVPVGIPEDVRIIRVEDGFLRSVGLGADLVRPISWVFDVEGIYYDARNSSDLEVLLQCTIFSDSEKQRAALLVEQIVQLNISKYNLSGSLWGRPITDRSVVLVIGQVETDASIAMGSVCLKRNMSLLRAVRKSRPDAWLVYKPHPDVVAGLRNAGDQEGSASEWADEVLPHGSLSQMFPLVDEVHVMTSLAGFEALLRGKTVFCYGQPFYSGWGLTHDLHPNLRRSRRLTLDELVAGALIFYPAYVGRVSRKRCTPEQAVHELVAWRDLTAGQLPWWRRALRPFLARS